MEKTKNCWVIPTDKPSRIHLDKRSKELLVYENFHKEDRYTSTYNIYIINNEEITGFENNIWVIKGDRIFLWQNTMVLVSNNKPKKIILTTDDQLIKDGVQAIDDDFLEWFVAHPSCESVEVEKQMLCDYCGQEDCDNLRCNGYKDSSYYEIIIPKEEPKQKNKKVCDCKRAYVNILSGICSLCWNEKFPNEKEEVKEEDLLELKQETLEKAAERIYPTRGLIEKYSELEVNIPNIIQGIKNLLYWFPIIWKDRNFDQHFIYEILKHKLKYQSKSILKNNIHTSAERNSRIMNICISLIDKVQSEFYLYEHLDYFELNSCTEEYSSKGYQLLKMDIKDDRLTLYFNKYKYIFKKQNIGIPITPRQRLYAANKIAEHNHNKAKNLLFKTIKENIDYWWD